MKSKTGWLLTLILSAVGLGVSSWQSYQFYQAKSGAAGFKSMCNFSSAMNCDVALASKYAELVGGIPLSSFAAGWFLGILFLAGMTLLSSGSRKPAATALTAMAGVGTAASAFYLYVMAVVLGSFCLFCLIIDFVNVSLLGIALLLRRSEKDGPTDSSEGSPWKVYAGTTAFSVFVALVLLRGFETRSIDSSMLADTVESVVSSAVLPISLDGAKLAMGPSTAPITIVEFSDFQCPHCRAGAMIKHQVQARWGDQVRVVLKNFPLDQACNPKVQHSMHIAACEAAKVVYCAEQQGKFAPVYEKLFEEQARLAPGKTFELAAQAGADVARLKSCVSEPGTGQAILKDLEEGFRLNVQSTPTFFVNGRRVEGAFPVEVWNRIIERLLAGGTK